MGKWIDRVVRIVLCVIETKRVEAFFCAVLSPFVPFVLMCSFLVVAVSSYLIWCASYLFVAFLRHFVSCFRVRLWCRHAFDC